MIEKTIYVISYIGIDIKYYDISFRQQGKPGRKFNV
jgi:hypothetical protein